MPCDPAEVAPLLREAEAAEVDAATADLLAAAFTLVKRCGWSQEQVAAWLRGKLQERLNECAREDDAFRAWYRDWAAENAPPA